MKAVHLVVVKKSLLTFRDVETLQEISAKDFVSEALSSGECDSLKQLLRRTGLDAKLQNTVRLMELAFQHVRGSESDKHTLRRRFVGMRVWNGFSSLLSTLNLTIFEAQLLWH